VIARRTGKAGPKIGTRPPRGGRGIAKPRLSEAEIAEFREALLAKRGQLLEDIGAMNGERDDDALELLESEWDLLRMIDAALGRIESGTYGICEATGKPITKARLRACPWARHCIEYARQHERPKWLVRRWDRWPDDPMDEQSAPDAWDILRRG
jgi:RNA polymerase-binding transcription factor DksA